MPQVEDRKRPGKDPLAFHSLDKLSLCEAWCARIKDPLNLLEWMMIMRW